MTTPKKMFNDEIPEKAIICQLPFQEGARTKWLPMILIEDGVENFYTTIPVPMNKFSLAKKKTLEEKKVKFFGWPALPYMGRPKGIKIYIDKTSVERFILPRLKKNDDMLKEISLSTGETLEEKIDTAVNKTAAAKPGKNPPGKRIFSLEKVCLVITGKYKTSMQAAIVEWDFSQER
jgi:predicted peroxiredoxin